MAMGKLQPIPSKIGEWETFIAINNGNQASVRPLLQQRKLDPNLRFRGTTMLATAIHRNSADILKVLLDHGANPNQKSNENDRYEPPIITATRLKHGHLVTILVEHGAELTLTNFYGEDVIFQAVVANAFEILSYFLSLKPHGSCVHDSVKVCPMQRAISEGEAYPSKRKCFMILLKYHYLCSCQRSSTNTFSRLLNYSNQVTKAELITRVYLSYGINLFSPEKANVQSNLNQLIKLTNLARISIRNEISNLAIMKQKSFVQELSKLPLPSKMIKFLLLDELPV